ncbi:MAG: zinc ribbon domain-containing protein [Deltaproteobacteria bacterium]|nr:zinc ribbon domain-containing protein [Deltaproteobacteria bacterium]MBT4527556.1 zinc ribbon domain-containing protein [Deltaproteobacteria bacterium]
MPLFEYKCQECGKHNELLVNRNETEVNCTYCGSTNLSKLFSAHSSLSGTSNTSFNTSAPTCCGANNTPSDCPGPGSCCHAPQ